MNWSIPSIESVEAALHSIFSAGRFVPRLQEALQYAVFPAGKRIRPLLAIGFCEDLGGVRASVVHAAAALELLHCSSLIHDDLPALDNDDMRRGKPSCHRAFGEATALLAGDIAISEAINLALKDKVSNEAKVEIVREVAAAYSELCNGQQLDLLTAADRGDVLQLYAKKTGALFAAACVIGAVSAGKSGKFLDSSREFGTRIGVLFQLNDDRIDDRPEKGRAEASDSKNKKITATTSEDPKRFDRLRLECRALLEELERQSQPLERVRQLTGHLLSAL